MVIRDSPLRAIAVLLAIAIALAGCGTTAKRESPAPVARAPDAATAPSRPATPRGGGYYLNDGPGDNPPPNLEQIPDAVPKREPLHRGAMRPYNVMGQNYTPMTRLAPYRARGTATWYGRRYHGQKTSSGEIYDMYQMTAAHTTLPIPSFARITNLATNKSVVVRINDRGPFHSDRLIDLSYTAAYKLGLLGGGRALVEVETILPDAGTPITPTVAASPAPAAAPVVDAVASAAAPAAPIAMPVVAVTAERKGMFLQLGAFGSRDNADNYLARLRAQVDWLAPALHVYPKDGLFRVHAGPYANQAEARTAADRISQALGIKTMVLVR
ncbi:MAG: septal ring lytic transglycosylase RlpA family protein [Betaproteobacteria bacterium]|nr:septal ring lytic transglycosylase RlpA family protein [Betaproteobacteria bacterium]MBI2289207.1 septal ring lytic transglycosylase RlpA family protein [Betaproteobacteria bacterium]MBI3056418.1 septal ring lytic transglycosylase RlpA family protein [Betaproteobacteria bacterium]